jgi:hypothetical protein
VRRALVAATALAAAGHALAHSTVPGGTVGAALADPALLIAFVAMALWIGQQGRVRLGLAAWTAAVATGLAANHWAGAARTQDALLAATAATGLLVVLARRWPAWGVVLVGALVGVNVGRGVELGASAGAARLATAGGAWLAAAVGVALGAWLVARLDRPWQRIGARVVASWLCAASVLVLAMAFAP